MNKLDVKPAGYEISHASSPDLQTASRLIVLVPEFEAEPAIVAQKIRDAAKVLESRVQLIGLSKDAAHEPGMRRQLVTLSAMVESSTVFVESNIVLGSNWLKAVSSNWHPGDVVVCFAGQRISNKPLSQLLQSSLNMPVYVLSGVQLEPKRKRPAWLSSALAWGGSISLILGFFWLQARLVQPAQSGIQTVLLYGSLIAEAGSIWFWNNLFN